MPIGKNALKRITNNGYSNVATAAPDMENSVVEEAPVINEIPSVSTPTEETSIRSTAAKKRGRPAKAKAETEGTAPEAKPEGKKRGRPAKANIEKKMAKTDPKRRGRKPGKTSTGTVKPEKKAKNKPEEKSHSYINIGGEMPIHLL